MTWAFPVTDGQGPTHHRGNTADMDHKIQVLEPVLGCERREETWPDFGTSGRISLGYFFQSLMSLERDTFLYSRKASAWFFGEEQGQS